MAMNLDQAIKFFNGIKNVKEYDKWYKTKAGATVGLAKPPKKGKPTIIDKLYDELLKISKFKAFTWTQPKKTSKKNMIIKFLKVMSSTNEKLAKEVGDLIAADFKDENGKIADKYILLGTLIYMRRQENPNAKVLWDKENNRPKLFLKHLHEEAVKGVKPVKEPTKPGKTVKGVEMTKLHDVAITAFESENKEDFETAVNTADENVLDEVFWTLYTDYLYSEEIQSKKKSYTDFLIESKTKSYNQLVKSPIISKKIKDGDKKVYDEKIKPYAINSTRKWLKMDEMPSPKVTPDLLMEIFTAKVAPKQKKKTPKKADILI